MFFLAGVDKAQFGTLIEDLNNSYDLAGNDQYPVPLDGAITLLSHYQGHRGSEHMDNDKNVSRETSFAQRKPLPAQQPRWQKSKKMRVEMGLQVLDPAQMGLQVLDPTGGWCNGQVIPRVVPHGKDNHECSNSAFFQRKNRKSVLAVCAI
jgi:hypothetical protein